MDDMDDMDDIEGMKSKSKTSKEIQAAYRQRMKEKGLRQKIIWVDSAGDEVVLTETWLYRYKGVELKFQEVQREIRKLINTAERGIVNNVEGKKNDLIKVSKLLEVVQVTLETKETTETMKEESKFLAKVKIQSKKKKSK
jgi:hypothetical protein